MSIRKNIRNWLRGKLADAVCDSYAAENQRFFDEIEDLKLIQRGLWGKIQMLQDQRKVPENT